MSCKSAYTPDMIARVVKAIELGATYQLAANYAGISYETLRKWRHAKREFREAIEQAEGRAAVKWLDKIEQAASEGTWQAAAWKLERRYPQDYGRTVQEQKITGDPEQPVSIRLVRVA